MEASRITPNAVTVIGFLGICAAAGLAIARLWVLASIVFVAAGLVDSLDGLLARHQGRVTAFGAFLDSTLDRLAEGVILGAIGITFAQRRQRLGARRLLRRPHRARSSSPTRGPGRRASASTPPAAG